jgi:isopenicillin-N epimerase
MRQAAADVARFVGAPADDLVFIDNTTAGVNAVMRSLLFEPGDNILVTDQAYGGILTAVRHVAGRIGATVTIVTVPYPVFDPATLVTRIVDALTPRTRLAIVEHIVSESALVLPVRAIVTACQERGVPVLVDGAHVPGALALDVSAIGADVYVANLHKWAMAPRSSAFMVVAPRLQSLMHPPVISWGYGRGFTDEFDWVGTRDPTPWLAAPDGIRFLESLGYDELRRHNHDLAWRAARYLSDRWKTPLGVTESDVSCMVAVAAPESVGSTTADAVRLRDTLLFDEAIEVQVHARASRVWIRVSAQVYNEDADMERLEGAVSRLAAIGRAPDQG